MAVSKPRLSPTEASQGSPRRMNLRVLIGSLGLALLAGLLLYAAYRSPEPNPIVQEQQK